MTKPIVWTIAGSDSSCGAGIQTDLIVFHQFGVRAASVITAVTAQNSREILATNYLSYEQIASQINALQDLHAPRVVKIGMLGSVNAIQPVKEFLKKYGGIVILDPVLKASSGNDLFDDQHYIEQLSQLFPDLYLLTPNIYEAEILTQTSIRSYADIKIAAQKLISYGIKNVLIKGGHFNKNNLSQDYWTNGKESFWLASPRLNKNCRGTGCTFSSAIAAGLALGNELKDVLIIAKMYLNRSIRLTLDEFLFHILASIQDEADLPYISAEPLAQLPIKFPDCGSEPLGLYPVVDSSAWIKKLLPLGVKTIQLRIKNKVGAELEDEIKESIEVAKEYGAKLFINDYWQLAIKHGAYGVHLGQDDLNTADINKIHQAGLRLGVSTHSYYEVAKAHAISPSYIASGPIFTTTSKVMPFAPQGIYQLIRWKHLLRRYPLVAIGGIDAEKISEVARTGVSGIALISAITQAQDPIAQTQHFLKIVEAQHA